VDKRSNSLLGIMLFLLLVAILVMPAITGSIICTKNNQVSTDLKSLTHIINRYFAVYQHFPKTNEGFDALLSHQLLPKLPRDPWQKPYHYQLIKPDSFSVCSSGENKVDERGAGDDLCNTNK
jgi:general secretion pathway protein G